MSRLGNYYIVEQVADVAEPMAVDVSPTLRQAKGSVSESDIRWIEPDVTDVPGPLAWLGIDSEGQVLYQIALHTLSEDGLHMGISTFDPAFGDDNRTAPAIAYQQNQRARAKQQALRPKHLAHTA